MTTNVTPITARQLAEAENEELYRRLDAGETVCLNASRRFNLESPPQRGWDVNCLWGLLILGAMMVSASLVILALVCLSTKHLVELIAVVTVSVFGVIWYGDRAHRRRHRKMKYLVFLIFMSFYLASSRGQSPDPTPLKCGKYQHVQYTPEHCANTCPPDGMSCTASCLYVPAVDSCVDDMHMVTEREWQEILARLKALETAKKGATK
jgi:hypothetical protein